MRIIHVLRKPLSEGTVASNVLKHGTGGINIDASRIGTDDNLNGGAYAEKASERHDGAENWRYKRGEHGNAGEYQPPSGRWPANVILQHLDGCRCDGVKDIGLYGGRIGSLPVGTPDLGYADEDGKESVANWICAEGCPVAGLDEQSGALKSGVMGGMQRGFGFHGIYGSSGQTKATCYADVGGASRFYKQIGGSGEEP